MLPVFVRLLCRYYSKWHHILSISVFLHVFNCTSLAKNMKSINKKLCAIFKTFKLQNYFSLKDETPLDLQANVVYLFEGSCDNNQTYIGKTKRHLATRVREHFSEYSAIFEHISSCNECNHSTIENFYILSHGSNDFDNKVKEALYTKKQKLLLNTFTNMVHHFCLMYSNYN